jgi:hypothetical protein
VANEAGDDHGVADAHVNDGDAGASADNPDEVTSAREKQLRLLFTFPILLGLFIGALNVLAVIRLWRTVYFSSFGMLYRANLPNTVCITSITISLFIGLSLIGYAIALRQFEGYSQGSESAPEITANQPLRRVSYVKWMIVPVLVAIPALALTVWAAEIVQPIAPKACIELYQEALNIKKDNPNFKMIWNDRDELRCSINQVLAQ